MAVSLKGANGVERALIVNALREKSRGDFDAASDLERKDPKPSEKSLIVTLREQALLADRLADEIES